MNKPINPNITIPEGFAANGVKADFDNDKILNGFDRIQPDVLAGDNLNKFIDDTYKGLNYAMAAADAINLINEGETLTVVDGQLASGAIEEKISDNSSVIAGYAMPSATRETLTLGASGTTYTAPANGWFMFNGSATAISGRVYLVNTTTTMANACIAPQVGDAVRTIMPCSKGDVIRADYSDINSTLFRFVYAKGSESEAN